MLCKQNRKSILLLILMSVTACATTDDAVKQETGGDKAIVAPAAQDASAGSSAVVPSLDDVRKEAEKIQQDDSAKTQAPSGKDDKTARVTQVKKIMKSKVEIEKKYETKQRGRDPNDFYRFKREKAVVQALIDDGVHDPAADLHDLQPPLEALKTLPTATFGNGVNWVAALNKHQINPRADQFGSKEQFTLDMNIPMEVAGTMNNVLFPHKAHTAWLDCSNCHPDIFQMKRGGNPITMKKINSGEYCGVCHGKVAFPIADCNRCHSVSKQAKNAVK